MNHLFPPDTEPATYAWIIDKDHLAEPGEVDEVGTMGPYNAPGEYLELLQRSPRNGRQFRMYDDDRILYYTGRIMGASYTDDIFWEDEGFGPLSDFGTPNAGAVDIQYKNEAGSWQSL